MVNIIARSIRYDNVIMDFDNFFDLYVESKYFGELDLYALKEIDNASILDFDLGTVKTPYGVTSMESLSTGCKVILSYLYIQRNKENYGGIYLDITECGSNALEVLFQCVDKLGDNETVFILRHLDSLEKVSNRDYMINGVYYNSLANGMWLSLDYN